MGGYPRYMIGYVYDDSDVVSGFDSVRLGGYHDAFGVNEGL